MVEMLLTCHNSVETRLYLVLLIRNKLELKAEVINLRCPEVRLHYNTLDVYKDINFDLPKKSQIRM